MHMSMLGAKYEFAQFMDGSVDLCIAQGNPRIQILALKHNIVNDSFEKIFDT